MTVNDTFYTNLLHDVQAIAKDAMFEPRTERAFEQTLIVPSETIKAVCQILKDRFGFQFMMDLTCVDFPERTKRFDVVYHLLDDRTQARLRLKTAVADGQSLESVCRVWRAANIFEREAYDLFGVVFDGHPDLRRILCHEDFKGHPLRKDYPAEQNQILERPIDHTFEKDRERLMKQFDEDLMWINIGPAHPSTHGTLRFMAVVDGGETVRDMDFEIGYLHRCFDKMCENHNYNQIIPYTDRLNYCSAPLNNNAFASTVEKLLKVDIPPRAKMMRMILDELSRIIDHNVCMGTNVMDMGALTGFFAYFNEREKVYTLFEKLCGARLTVSLTRIGGMGFDLPSGWLDELKAVCDSIEKTNEDMAKFLLGNRIFIQRAKGSGAFSPEHAIDYGFTGPCLRATGYGYDVRKAQPYYLYNEVDFDIPVGHTGDVFDRFLVRMEEVRQSLKIIRWCIANMPGGPISIDDKSITLPSKQDVYGNIEGLMNHFMLVINGVKTPVGEVYHAAEGANGELGFYIVSDGTGTPYRVKVRPPCFALMGGFREMSVGSRIADVIASLGSVNFIAGELDR